MNNTKYRWSHQAHETQTQDEEKGDKYGSTKKGVREQKLIKKKTTEVRTILNCAYPKTPLYFFACCSHGTLAFSPWVSAT
jgi:hypothetical protein